MRYRIVSVFLALSVLSLPSRAQEIEYLSSTLYSGGITAIVVLDNYAYCSIGRTLLTLSVSDPTSPTIIDANPGLGGDGAVLRGDYIYFTRVYNENPRVQVVDISDRLNPVEVVQFSSSVDHIAFDSNFIYLARSNAGLSIFDNSDPANPVQVSTIYTRELAFGVAVSARYAYIADGDSGLTVIDVSDPQNPGIVGHNNTSSLGGHRFRSLALSGSYAYVADAYYGLRVFRISDPLHPFYFSDLALEARASEIFIEGTLAYITIESLGEGEVYIVNISDPSNPQLLGSYNAIGDPARFFKSDTLLYVGGLTNYGSYDRYGLMHVLNVSNPDTLIMIGSYTLPQHSTNCVYVDGNNVYAGDFRFYMVDYSNPISPVPLGSYRTVAAQDVYFRSGYAYVISNSALKVLSYADPAHPVLAGISPIARDARSICLKDNYAFIASTPSGLSIYDISDTVHAAQVGSYHGNEGDRDVAIRDDYAYLAEDYDGLNIVDIHDPTNPVSIGRLGSENYMEKVRLTDNYLYALAGGQMLIIDVSDPTDPALVSIFDPSSWISNIQVQGNIAYLLSSPMLILVDISEPSMPVELASRALPSYANDIFVSGDLIYVAVGTSLLLYRYPITSIEEKPRILPENDATLSCYPNPFNSQAVLTYSAGRDASVDIYDIGGRKVETVGMINGSAVWDASAYASGVFFAKLRSNNKEGIKLLLLK